MSSPHPLVQLARQAIEGYVRDGRRISAPPAAERTPEMLERAGAFVSLHRQGELRGCIGTFLPVNDSLAEEIIDNAISAATRDPRFFPLEPDELDDLELSVDVLSPPEPIQSPAELDPKRYGVIVEHDRKRGLLLPDLPQVTTVEDQIEIAKQKAGIGPREPYKLYRFHVQRYY